MAAAAISALYNKCAPGLFDKISRTIMKTSWVRWIGKRSSPVVNFV
jgi:hypothetical protein